MATSQNLQSAGSPAPAGLTAQEVVVMFKGLDLPVCDDLASIQQKVKEKQGRYLKDGNSPDRDLALKAKIWMKNAEAMENRRPDLLRVVYEAFRLDCDTAV